MYILNKANFESNCDKSEELGEKTVRLGDSRGCSDYQNLEA